MRVLSGVFFLTLLLFSVSYADRGSVSFYDHVEVFEPDQNAFIAWDGDEEILIISTNMYASEKTKVLEILPLPSEPAIQKANTEMFTKAVKVINRMQKRLWALQRLPKEFLPDDELSQARGIGMDSQVQPAAEVKFHEKIGSHDISTIHVLEDSRFVQWVEKYLRSAGAMNQKVPDYLMSIVNQYIREGFTWFVFDVLELDNSIKTNEAIQYRFASNKLFYPLRISKTNKGSTEVSLIVLTPQLISNFRGIKSESIELGCVPVKVTPEELKDIDEGMYDFLAQFPSAYVRIWKIKGEFASFDNDVLGEGFSPYADSDERYIDPGKYLELRGLWMKNVGSEGLWRKE